MAVTDPDLDESTYGPDGQCDAGFDRPAITMPRVQLENCARVIETPLGALFFDTSAGVTRPLQSLMNAVLDDADLIRIGGEWGTACRAQVQGVTRARFTLSRASNGKGITFRAIIDTAAGVFSLSGSAGDVIQVLVPQV
jgi:hypothetical protein